MHRGSLLLALLVVLVLAGCGVPASRMTSATAYPRSAFGSFLAQSQDLGLVSSRSPVSTILVLRNANRTREDGAIAAMYRPGSPSFGHFLSAAAVRRYGPPAAAVRHVISIVRRERLHAAWQRGDGWLVVRGPARAMERFFHVAVHAYRTAGGSWFYAAAATPAVPLPLKNLVTAVGRISSYQPVERLHPAMAVPNGGLSPSGLIRAYDMQPLRQRTDGSGQTVVFFEQDGYRQSDLDQYANAYHLPPIRPTLIGPQLPSLGEAEMDIEVVHAIAPGARLVVYNFDINKASQQANTDHDLYAALDRAQHDMLNRYPHAIFSESFGLCEQGMGNAEALALGDAYRNAPAMGDSIFVSSGDSGAYECLRNYAKGGTPPSPQYVAIPCPACLPYVTAVGGTRLSVDQQGDWYSETVWEDPAETAGTGGGVSGAFTLPPWQRGPDVGNEADDPKRMREIPDISADADPASGVRVYVRDSSGASWGPGGGTSQAAPILAGMTALIDAYLHKQGLGPAGFLNPAIYALESKTQPYVPYHDVTLGNNLLYPARQGYDAATGVGTPDAWNFARDLAAYMRGAS